MTDAVSVPVLPAQTATGATLHDNWSGCVIVIEAVLVQDEASLTVIVYVPAAKPLNVDEA